MCDKLRGLCVLATLVALVAPWSSAQAASQGSRHLDGPAELPRVYIRSSLADTPTPGKVWKLREGDSVQRALNRAACGDTIELQPAATFDSSFDLPSKACDDTHWIVLRTAGPESNLPGEGTRVTPCYAAVSSLPGRPAFHCPSTQNVMARIAGSKGKNRIIGNDAGASHYRLVGLEISDTGANGSAGGFCESGLLEKCRPHHFRSLLDPRIAHRRGRERSGVRIQFLSLRSLILLFLTFIPRHRPTERTRQPSAR